MSLTVNYDLPVTREQYASAYDPDRDCVVLFGGSDAGSPFTFYNDTWEYDGQNWVQVVTANSPDPRSSSALVYDTVRKVMVLFSGVDATTFFDETWEYDGTDWTLQTPGASPGGRDTPGMIYDPDRAVTVMFGGQDATTAQNDTWEYNGSTWGLISTATSPAGRSVEALVYDTDRNKTVMFGGIDGFTTTFYNDTWEYDGTDWTLISTGTSPVSRCAHAMSYDKSIKQCVMFGGLASDFLTTLSDTWFYDGTDWVEYTAGSTSPLPQTFFRMTYDSLRERTVAFGGDREINLLTFNFVLHQETWAFDTSTPDPWKQLSLISKTRAVAVSAGARPAADSYGWVDQSPATTPPARALSAAVYDPVRKRTVIFGGDGTSALLNDTWEWDGFDWIQNATSTLPSARKAHALVYDTVRSQVVMFGGIDIGGDLNDTWVYDGVDWTVLSPATSPAIRGGAAAGYDSDRDRIVLFGGDGATILADTWEYDGTTWAPITPVTIPPARSFAMSDYDVHRKRLVVFGGLDNGSSDLADTWEYDGNDWSQITTTTTPTGRSTGAGVYNPTDQRFIIFGGVNDASTVQFDDTWEFDGLDWTDLTIATLKPTARDSHTLSYEGNSDSLTLHSGALLLGAGSFTDTLCHPAEQNPKVLGPEDAATGLLATFVATVTATDPDEVTFTIVVNGTQRWWDGTSWTKSNESFARSSSAADINTNVAALDVEVGDLLQVCALLHSDNGLTFPEVDDSTITFGTPPGVTVATFSENPLGHLVVEMSIGTVLTVSGAVSKILITLKSVGVLTPTSTQFIADNDLIPEILVRAGLAKDASFATLNETTSGTQGDLFIYKVELTP